MVEKQDEPPWNRDERIEIKEQREEIEKGEEDALPGLAAMFSGKFTDKQEEEARKFFQPNFGPAFRKEREAMKHK